MNVNKQWTLRGITSAALTDEKTNKCDVNSLAVYTDAAKFTDWMNEIMKNYPKVSQNQPFEKPEITTRAPTTRYIPPRTTPTRKTYTQAPHVPPRLAQNNQVGTDAEICGLPVIPPHRALIYKGRPVYKGEMPWLAAYVEEQYDNLELWCGAVLVSSKLKGISSMVSTKVFN